MRYWLDYDRVQTICPMKRSEQPAAVETAWIFGSDDGGAKAAIKDIDVALPVKREIAA
jgi:hypothetical protein